MSALLLDTQIVIWWFADDLRLGPRVRSMISAADQVNVSAATTWEVAIQQTLGRLTLELPPGVSFSQHASDQGFELAPVEHEDAWAVRELPAERSDPFDRLLAATARRRGWTLVSADPVFERLDVTLVRA